METESRACSRGLGWFPVGEDGPIERVRDVTLGPGFNPISLPNTIPQVVDVVPCPALVDGSCRALLFLLPEEVGFLRYLRTAKVSDSLPSPFLFYVLHETKRVHVAFFCCAHLEYLVLPLRTSTCVICIWQYVYVGVERQKGKRITFATQVTFL